MKKKFKPLTGDQIAAISASAEKYETEEQAQGETEQSKEASEQEFERVDDSILDAFVNPNYPSETEEPEQEETIGETTTDAKLPDAPDAGTTGSVSEILAHRRNAGKPTARGGESVSQLIASRRAGGRRLASPTDLILSRKNGGSNNTSALDPRTVIYNRRYNKH